MPRINRTLCAFVFLLLSGALGSALGGTVTNADVSVHTGSGVAITLTGIGNAGENVFSNMFAIGMWGPCSPTCVPIGVLQFSMFANDDVASVTVNSLPGRGIAIFWLTINGYIPEVTTENLSGPVEFDFPITWSLDLTQYEGDPGFGPAPILFQLTDSGTGTGKAFGHYTGDYYKDHRVLNDYLTFNLDPAAVPEPSSLVLVAAGSLLLAARFWAGRLR